jgi:hypothetical protein
LKLVILLYLLDQLERQEGLEAVHRVFGVKEEV